MELVIVIKSLIVQAPGKACFIDIVDDSGLSKEKEKGMISILQIFFYFSCRKQSLNHRQTLVKRMKHGLSFQL